MRLQNIDGEAVDAPALRVPDSNRPPKGTPAVIETDPDNDSVASKREASNKPGASVATGRRPGGAMKKSDFYASL